MSIQSENNEVELKPSSHNTNENNAENSCNYNDVVQKEENSLPTCLADPSLPFQIGDLVWAYISGYPLWPSLITPDPLESLYTKTRSIAFLNICIFKLFLDVFYIKSVTGKAEVRVYHVEFFGDNGSHSWLSSNVLFPFNGSVEELLKDKSGFVKHVLFFLKSTSDKLCM